MMAILVLLMMAAGAPIQSAAGPALTPGVKVFVHPMPNDFDRFFKAALTKKKVPVVVVTTRDAADFEIKGTSDSQKAGAAKKIIMGSWHSDEQASISVSSVASGEIVYAYSANKKNSAHGQQTTAEACAKHLGEALKQKR
jgi:hypothetical protein